MSAKLKIYPHPSAAALSVQKDKGSAWGVIHMTSTGLGPPPSSAGIFNAIHVNGIFLKQPCHQKEQKVQRVPLDLMQGFAIHFEASFNGRLAFLQLLSSHERKKMVEELLKEK